MRLDPKHVKYVDQQLQYALEDYKSDGDESVFNKKLVEILQDLLWRLSLDESN